MTLYYETDPADENTVPQLLPLLSAEAVETGDVQAKAQWRVLRQVRSDWSAMQLLARCLILLSRWPPKSMLPHPRRCNMR